MIHVRWKGSDGSSWHLEGDLRKAYGVVLSGVSGLVSPVTRTTVPRSTGIGVDITNVVTGAMEGTLKLTITHSDLQTIGEVYRAFLKSLSTRIEGTLIVIDSEMHEWSTRAVISEPMAATERSPFAPDLWIMTIEVPIFAPDGVWIGEARRWTGQQVTIINRGDLEMFPIIQWVGSGQWIALPGGVTFALPDTPTTRFLSTDPGNGYVVTDADGQVDTDLRAAMRGRPVLGRTEPKQSTTWDCDPGITLITRELIESPWR